MRPLLLGESPSPAAGPDGWRSPLSGRSCASLCALVGIDSSYESLRERFELRNLVVRAEEAENLPSSWWLSLSARTRFEQVWESSVSASCVVCLGRKVAAAAGIGDAPWGAWSQRRSSLGPYRPIVVIPHPSGLNRLYNEEEMRDLAGRVLKEALGCGA